MKWDALLVPVCLSDGARTASLTSFFSALTRPFPSFFRYVQWKVKQNTYMHSEWIVLRPNISVLRIVYYVMLCYVIMSQLCHEQIHFLKPFFIPWQHRVDQRSAMKRKRTLNTSLFPLRFIWLKMLREFIFIDTYEVSSLSALHRAKMF